MNSHEIFAVGVGNNRAEYSYLHSGAPRTSTAFDLKEKAEILLDIGEKLVHKDTSGELLKNSSKISFLSCFYF